MVGASAGRVERALAVDVRRAAANAAAAAATAAAATGAATARATLACISCSTHHGARMIELAGSVRDAVSKRCYELFLEKDSMGLAKVAERPAPRQSLIPFALFTSNGSVHSSTSNGSVARRLALGFGAQRQGGRCESRWVDVQSEPGQMSDLWGIVR